MKSLQVKISICLFAITGLLQKPGFSQITVGSTAPAFQAQTVGSPVEFIFPEKLQRPVIMFFWAMSQAEIADLKILDNFARSNSGAFQVISVFFDDKPDIAKVESILRANSISLATLLTNAELENRYEIDLTPTILVINTNKQIVLSKAGSRLTPDVFELIKKLCSGSLTVNCNQSGTRVYLNDGYIGIIFSTGFKISDLKSGTYQLRVQKSDEYTIFTQPFSITCGQNTTVNAYLSPIGPPKGSLIITCNLEGAEVYLDGIWQGRIVSGSLKISNLTSGFYNLKVQDKGQDNISEQPVRINSGQNTNVTITLKPIEPVPPVRRSASSSWKETKSSRSIGSYVGFFAGYTIPLGNLKNAFNDQQPVNLGARIRLMSKKALAWEFSANYYQFKNDNDAYQLTQRIIPITFNASIGMKYFYITGGGGYYFSRYTYTFESAFVSSFEGKLDRWGLNTGVGIGFAFFEIGARYHYMLKDAKNYASSQSFLDIYGGITPIFQAKLPDVNKERQKELAFTYSYFPASADINPN